MVGRVFIGQERFGAVLPEFEHMAAQMPRLAEGEVEAGGFPIGFRGAPRGFGDDAVPGPLAGEAVVAEALLVVPAAAEQDGRDGEDHDGGVSGPPGPVVSGQDRAFGQGDDGGGHKRGHPRPHGHLYVDLIVTQPVEKPSQRVGEDQAGDQRAGNRHQQGHYAETPVVFLDGDNGGEQGREAAQQQI